MTFTPASSLPAASVAVVGPVSVTQGTSPWVTDGSAVVQPVSGPLTDAQLRASAPRGWDGSGSTQPVDGSAVTQPVSGAVSVSNFPATQPVSGSVNVGNFPATQPVSGTVAVSAVAGTVAVTQSTSPWVTDGSATTQPVSGSVSVGNFPATQAVSVATLPLPTGAATESTLALAKAALNDVALTAILEREKVA